MKIVVVEMGGVETVIVEVEFLGVQGVGSRGVGEELEEVELKGEELEGVELEGAELEGVELEGVEAVQVEAHPIQSDRTQKFLTDTTTAMGDRTAVPIHLRQSRVQVDKSTELKTDGVLGACSVCNHSQVTGQIHRAKVLE